MRYLVLIFNLIFLISCNNHTKNKEIKLAGNVFGTTFHITYQDTQKRDFSDQLDSLFHLENKSLSTYIPTSDISKINRGDTAVVVDAMFKEVFQKSRRIFEETAGAFDPTIGVLVNAWGFGPKNTIENLDSVKVKELLTYVGFDKVKLENNKVVKVYPETYFDFNAIAKGYGVDLVGRFLETQNIQNYLVEIGGEVRARGVNAKGKPWKVAIEKPNFDGSRSVQTVIALENQSIATSGNYRKFKIDPKTGEKYAHTMNTKTGYSAKRDLLSASVVSSLDCADVDGYATAFMAMGFEKSKLFLENRPELKAILIYVDDSGETKVYDSVNQ